MACGTPVVGLAYGSVPEVVENGINGFVCTSVEGMVVAVGKVHTLDRLPIRKIVEQKYSNTKATNDYLSLYKTILNRRK